MNDALKRLETAIQRLLAHHGCPADAEIKGTVGYLEDGRWKSGSMGKLPIHRPEWDPYDFDKVPHISFSGLEYAIRYFNEHSEPSALEQMNERKKQVHVERQRVFCPRTYRAR